MRFSSFDDLGVKFHRWIRKQRFLRLEKDSGIAERFFLVRNVRRIGNDEIKRFSLEKMSIEQIRPMKRNISATMNQRVSFGNLNGLMTDIERFDRPLRKSSSDGNRQTTGSTADL